MEVTSSFELDRAIQHWRETLAQSPAFRTDNLDELESHLRDSIARFESVGLSGEEAFPIAARRLGSQRALGAEFQKVNRKAIWIERMVWMLIGLQVWQLVSGPVGLISNGVVSLGLLRGNFNFDAYGQTFPVLLFACVRLLALVGSLAICWWLVVRRGQGFALRIERLLKGWLGLAIVCGMLCVVSWAVSALGALSWTLVTKFASPQAIGEIMTSQTYSNAFGWFVQTGVFILLTLILARKRLQLQKV